MKLTKQQKKKYVKRSKLVIANRNICALIEQHNRIWTAIDKLPADVHSEFLTNADLNGEALTRETNRIVSQQMREYIDKMLNLFSVIVDSTRMARIKDIWTSGEFTVPDELDDKPSANQEAQG